MTVLDVTTPVWLAAAAAGLYVGVPLVVRRLCRAEGPGTIALVAGLLLWTVVGMTGLSALSLVNPATVLALHSAYGLTVFAASHRCFDHGTERLLRAVAALRDWLPAARRMNTRAASALVRQFMCAAMPMSASHPHLIAFTALITVVAGIRMWPAVNEARLFDPSGYQDLFLVRRVIDGPWPGITPAAPAWSAALATLSAMDPAYVARFLPALLACAVTWALPRVVLGLSQRVDAAVVAVSCWFLAGSGLAVASPWASIVARQYVLVDAYVAALFLLALLADTHRHGARSGERILIASAVMVFSPPLGVAAAVALGSPTSIRPGVVACTWVAIAIAGLNADAPLALRNAATTLPVALALSAAMVCVSLPRRIYLPERSGALACGAAIAVGGFSVVPPSRPMEHDQLARQALRIVGQSSEGDWTIVAREVPLLHGHGGGHVMTIPMFVACSSGAALPECVAAQRTTTYVIVQKRPFDVAGLVDEQAALAAVERLVHATKGSHIDHEDDVLRVYVVPPQRWAL